MLAGRKVAAVDAEAPRSLTKLHSIQLLRAIAAMLVVLFHAQQAFANRFAEPAFASESYLFAFGSVGVHIFFVISGFIMVYTTRFEGGYDAKAFYRRRLLRIYPIYWLCMLLYIIGHWLVSEPYTISMSELAGAMFLLPDNASAVIGPAWTLAFEMYFYLCFGLAMIAGLNRGLVLLASGFVLLIATGLAVDNDSPAWHLVSNTLLLEFLAGTGIAWLLAKGHLPSSGGWLLVGVAAALFAGGVAYGYERLPSVLIWGFPSTLLVAGAVIIETARGTSGLVRVLARFGDSSYALYLVHVLVITFSVALARDVPLIAGIEPALASIPIAMVSLTVAEFLHHRIERPLLRRLNPNASRAVMSASAFSAR